MDKDKILKVVYLDFSKALDIVFHNVLCLCQEVTIWRRIIQNKWKNGHTVRSVDCD